MKCEICYSMFNNSLIQIPVDSIKFLKDYKKFELEQEVISKRLKYFSEYNNKILFCNKCIERYYKNLEPKPKLYGLGFKYFLDKFNKQN